MNYVKGMVSDQVVEAIRNEVYELLDQLGEYSFDYSHIRTVTGFVVEIAELRGLDKNVAEVIGLMHDIARVQQYVLGHISFKTSVESNDEDSGEYADASHGIVGSKVAASWLSEYGVDPYAIGIICDAIAVHSKKKKIHGPYAELIKDADSLAHMDEFPGEGSKYELARQKFALKQPFGVKLDSEMTLNGHYKSHMKFLQNCLKHLDYAYLTALEVHDVRTEIRTIRSMLWLIGNDTDEIISIRGRQLKKIFKIFEQSRKYSVLKKSLKKAGIEKKNFHNLNVLIKKENRQIAVKVQKRLHKDEVLWGSKKLGDLTDVESRLIKKIDNYRSQSNKASKIDLDDLHELRIQGKRFKYMAEEGIIHLGDADDLRLISNLHDQIGKLNDIEENRRLLEYLEQERCMILSEDEKALMKAYYKMNEKRVTKKVKLMLFRLRSRLLMTGQ